METNSKAAALRWLAARVGQEIDTVRVRPDGMKWEPGRRTLTRRGRNVFELDGSAVRIEAGHVVLKVSDELLRLEWQDDEGTQLSVTTYSDPPADDDDDDDQ